MFFTSRIRSVILKGYKLSMIGFRPRSPDGTPTDQGSIFTGIFLRVACPHGGQQEIPIEIENKWAAQDMPTYFRTCFQESINRPQLGSSCQNIMQTTAFHSSPLRTNPIPDLSAFASSSTGITQIEGTSFEPCNPAFHASAQKKPFSRLCTS